MNLKNQKGINMITLSIAVLILIIITSVLVYNSADGVKIKSLYNLYNDIEELNDKVGAYYLKNGDLPKGPKYENTDFLNTLEGLDDKQKNPNNSNDFYVINLQALEGVSLNFGWDFDEIKGKKSDETESTLTDLYIVNEESHTIYYPHGIEVKNKKYYTEPNDDWTSVNLSVIPIYTAEQLAKVGSGETIKINQTGSEYKFTLNSTYVLQNDIDLNSYLKRDDTLVENDENWIPIGTNGNSFTGVFYGNGHVISNININTSNDYQGLFGAIGANGKVSYVNVRGRIDTTGSNVGGIAGTLNSNGSIEDCRNNIIIEQKFDKNLDCIVGGICGSNNGTITKCQNFALISSTFINASGNTNYRNNVGGIAGTSPGVVQKCFNQGNIKGICSGTYSDVGGIVGTASGKILESCNVGKIYGDAVNSPLIGGIVGVATSSNAIVNNCYNSGELSAIKSSAWLGGIVGDVFSNSSCQNSFSVGTSTLSNTIIRGKAIGTLVNNGTIKNCYGLNSNYNTLTANDSAEGVQNSRLKSSSEMKLQEFVDLLNTDQGTEGPWVMDTIGENNGYPIFNWQIE